MRLGIIAEESNLVFVIFKWNNLTFGFHADPSNIEAKEWKVVDDGDNVIAVNMLKFVPLNDDGTPNIEAIEQLVNFKLHVKDPYLTGICIVVNSDKLFHGVHEDALEGAFDDEYYRCIKSYEDAGEHDRLHRYMMSGLIDPDLSNFRMNYSQAFRNPELDRKHIPYYFKYDAIHVYVRSDKIESIS